MYFFILIFILSGLIARNLHFASVLSSDWDEGMYAQIAVEIIKNKSLFTTFNGHLWFDKPPLVHGAIAIIFSIFGRSEFWARMLSLVAAFLLLTMIFLLAKKILVSVFKNETKTEINLAAILPVLVFSASPAFLERATLLNSDLFVAIGWLGYFLCWNNFWGRLFFISFGVLSKSVLGFYPLAFTFLSWLIKKNRITTKSVLENFFLLVVPSLWYLAGFLKFGWFFIDNHFSSQMFKRLYVPIELHFGNKFFYFNYLWQNLGFINIFFLISYVLLIIDSRSFIKKSGRFALLTLSVPLPFFALLTLMKTKITWYVVIFLPFLSLLLAYLYLKIGYRWLRKILLLSAFIYFMINFINQTFLLKINYSVPDKLALAKCLSEKKIKKVSFLVDEQERKNRNFLEAAHYDTTSSFLYGGSPSFVYYLQKEITYYYNIHDFINERSKYDVWVLSVNDFDSGLKNIQKKTKVICQFKDWISIIQSK